MHEKGQGTETSAVKAIQYYEKAASLGSVDATFQLGVMYQSGQEIGKDFAKAREYYERAAKSYHNTALFNLGVMYRYGMGVDANAECARHYYEAAAAAGNNAAMFNLGVMHQTGVGVERIDLRQARTFYEEAVEGGNVNSMSNLAWMCVCGEGAEKDLDRARELYQIAVSKGNVWAQCCLTVLFCDDNQKLADELADIWEKHAGTELAGCVFQLADRYLSGDGVQKDVKRAKILFGLAAALGHGEATSAQALLATIQSTRAGRKGIVTLDEDWADKIVLGEMNQIGKGSFCSGELSLLECGC